MGVTNDTNHRAAMARLAAIRLTRRINKTIVFVEKVEAANIMIVLGDQVREPEPIAVETAKVTERTDQ